MKWARLRSRPQLGINEVAQRWSAADENFVYRTLASAIVGILLTRGVGPTTCLPTSGVHLRSFPNANRRR